MLTIAEGKKRMLFKCHNGVETDNGMILEAQTAMTTLLGGSCECWSAKGRLAGSVVVSHHTTNRPPGLAYS
jgi:hypothetical protein